VRFWKSIHSKKAPDQRQDEFPEELPVGTGVRQLSRRDFFRWSGLGFAVSLAAGCDTKKAEKALAYIEGREGITPGVDLWYASLCSGCSAGCGVVAKVRDGRPIKLEGNPEDSLNRGALCAVGQAQVRGLFDGGRLRGPLKAGSEAHWADLDRDLISRFTALKDGKVRVLSGSLGPSQRRAVEKFLGGFKDGKHVVYDALSQSALAEAYERTHGQRLVPAYQIDRADVIVAVEADFLGSWINPAAFGRAYASRRKPDAKMSRHIHVESGMTLSGSNADERIRVAPSEAVAFLEHLACAVEGGSPVRALEAKAKEKVHALAQALEHAEGRSLVLCGLNDVHAQIFAARLNKALGNEGTTLDLARPSLQKQGDDKAALGLIQEMKEGQVDAVVVMEANPVYELSAFGFKEAFAKVGLRVSLGTMPDETAMLCTHVAPDHHGLEGWRDAEPVRGRYRLGQPLLNPLFQTREACESLLLWAGAPISALEWVKGGFQAEVAPKAKGFASFDAFWNELLQKGFVDVDVTASAPTYREDRARTQSEWTARKAEGGEFELRLYAKGGIQEGRHAFNPWLQELPDPITKITWDNYALVSPASAERMKLAQGDVVRLRRKGANDLVLPVVVQPGLHDRAVSVALGYGRTQAGKHGTGVGVDAYPWLAFDHTSVEVSPTPQKAELACTQDHHLMEGRELVREFALAGYLKDPASARPIDGGVGSPVQPSIYAGHPKGPHHWAMVIDLSKCSGCSSCVIACQAENNIPVVGKDEVRRKREMHWMRIDRYYTGDEHEPGVVHQPMMCQQCDNAPCENVCPVVATVHSEEGLNQQVYNRCVGTRYCANNCPYKTRRFNWFNYDHADPVEQLVLNPDVTVRSRGVMEKCSFCVQRIQLAKATAKNEGRELKDGECKTACQQSCPGMAILFGDMLDPESEISQALKDPKRYMVLGELGVAPAVNYLAKIRNAESAAPAHGGHHA
jgi:Fe-S-cluster-containing dehydrogenase component